MKTEEGDADLVSLMFLSRIQETQGDSTNCNLIFLAEILDLILSYMTKKC